MRGLMQLLLGFSHDDLAGVEGWSLRLTGVPENLWVLLGILAAFGVMGWLAVRNYRREGRTHHGIKALLAGLRLAALALLLLLALQPALVSRLVKVRHTAVAVLLDDTMSMRWADRYGADSAPGLAAAFGVPAERLTGADRLSRTDLLRRVLPREGGALGRLAGDHPLLLYRFGAPGAEEGTYTAPLGAVELPAPPGATAAAETIRKAAADLAAGGHQTSLGRAVREVLNKLEGRALAAVVVVSDGQNTGEADAAGRVAAAAEMARSRGVGVYCVGVGDPKAPKNVLVAQLQGPGEVRKGGSAQFTAMLTSRGYADQTVKVELLCARAGSSDWQVAATAEGVRLAGAAGDEHGGALQEVPLTAEAPDVGAYVYKALVRPLADELITTDNEAACRVRVSDEKVAVLLVSGDAGWEYQYLRDYLLRHPEHYKISVWQQNADPNFNQDASTGMKRSSLPITRDELFAYDVVILYDPWYDGQFDSAFLTLLEKFVAGHHGGLCYIAGNKFTSANLAPGGPLAGLAELLPVVLRTDGEGLDATLGPPREAWPVRLTSDGADHPLTMLATRLDDSRQIWQKLPGIYRSQPVSRLKTAATALAFSGDPSRQTLQAQGEPVIAVQYYGKGRVLYLGADSTWRWRALDDGRHYVRFWGNALDFLAAGRLEKKRILITTPGEAFDAGGEIRVRVEAYNRDFTPMEGKSFTVRVAPEGGAQPGRTVELPAVRPGTFEGTVLAERTGSFELTPVAGPDGRSDWLPEDVAVRRIEVRLPAEELRRPEANFQTLRALAGQADRFCRLDQIDRLAEMIPPGRLKAVEEVRRPLWSTILALLAVGVLLLAEWTVRKVFNMM